MSNDLASADYGKSAAESWVEKYGVTTDWGEMSMGVDRHWLAANLGGATEKTPARLEAEGETPKSADQLGLERIEFDSEGPEGAALRADWPKAPPTLSKAFRPIAWPDQLAPQPATEMPAGESLPEADVLIVTWTVEEAHALSRVLTPGLEGALPGPGVQPADNVRYWQPYVKNFEAISSSMTGPRASLPGAGRVGSYWTLTVAGIRATVFKSESHFSHDGPRDLATSPNRTVWEQIIADTKPRWVISTGTGGGIGTDVEVGDVIVSSFVAFDTGGEAPNIIPFLCDTQPSPARFSDAARLFGANAQYLPASNGRPPRIVQATAQDTGVLTTAGFEYDDTSNSFHLQGHGDVCEMGDAMLGAVCASLGPAAPNYVLVRNVSDPQIDSSQPDGADLAAYIYLNWGRWSSVCSAITCWAILAGGIDV